VFGGILNIRTIHLDSWIHPALVGLCNPQKADLEKVAPGESIFKVETLVQLDRVGSQLKTRVARRQNFGGLALYT
jgi:hypothetical protein